MSGYRATLRTVLRFKKVRNGALLYMQSPYAPYASYLILRMLLFRFSPINPPPPLPLNSIASAAKLPLAALAAWPFFLLQLQPQSFHSVAALQRCSIAALRLSSLSLLYTLSLAPERLVLR